MEKHIIAENVKPGSGVWTGYTDQRIIAPEGTGTYRLVQLSKNNQHICFIWEAE